MKELSKEQIDAILKANYDVRELKACYSVICTLSQDSLAMDNRPLHEAYMIGAACSASPGVVSTAVLDEIRRLSTYYVELNTEFRGSHRVIPRVIPSYDVFVTIRVIIDALDTLVWAVKTAYLNADAKIFGEIDCRDVIGPVFSSDIPTPERWEVIKCFIENPEVVIFVESQLKAAKEVD